MKAKNELAVNQHAGGFCENSPALKRGTVFGCRFGTTTLLAFFTLCAVALHVRAEEKPSGLLPVPDYSGDFWTRGVLTGDWGGVRSDLANKGVQFGVDWNQVVQGVVDGGRDRTTVYGGTLDYTLNLDLMRMGVLPGALVKVRAESRYGRSVNGVAGPILPVNTDALFPLTAELDDDIAITITDLSYTQFLSEHLGVLVGKFDTLDDPRAAGRIGVLRRIVLRGNGKPAFSRLATSQFIR